MQFGVEHGLVENRFIPSGKHSLNGIFLRFDCQSNYKMKKMSDKYIVSCSMTIMEHQWDKIYQFTKKNKKEWDDIRGIFEAFLFPVIDDKSDIQQVRTQWKLSKQT